MIHAFLDEEATRAGDRYVAFLLSLRAVLNASLAVRPEDNRAFDAIRRGAAEVAEVFLENEAERFANAMETAQERAVEQARSDVLSDAPTKEIALQDYGDELLAWYASELRAQIERDVNVLIQKRRELVLAAQTTARSRGKDLNHAYLQVIASGRESVSFYFTDRSGRKYPSQKYVRQLTRHALLTFAVESYVLEAASFGVERVYVTHPDNNNSYSGETVTLVGEPNVLSLADIREEVFHPNSNAFLTTDPAA